jgi:Type I restriction-modification system methyltransferase subunit
LRLRIGRTAHQMRIGAQGEKWINSEKKIFAPLRLYGQENISSTWAMAKMNMVIHDMEGEIELGDTFNNPKFKDASGKGIKKFNRCVANPMWNQPGFNEEIYTNDIYGRFPAGNPGGKGDWGWVQHIYSSLNDNGRAAIVLDTGGASRGSGNANTNKEKDVRKWFIDHDIIEGVLYLPENLFYNTTAPGIIIFLNKSKPANLKDKVFLINPAKNSKKAIPKIILATIKSKKFPKHLIQKRKTENFSKFIGRDEIAKKRLQYFTLALHQPRRNRGI